MDMRRVAESLRTFDPANFESLAAQFARIRHPELFPRLDPVGLSAVGIPVRSKFDFQCLHDDGWALGEATTTARPSDVRRHIEERIAAIEMGALDVVAFVYVSLCSTPDRARLKQWRDRLVATGIPPKQIHLWFGNELVSELAGPDFAQLRTRFGIPENAWPFRILSDLDWNAVVGTYAPTIGDLASQQPRASHEHQAAGLLATEGGVALAGGPGTGKTLLAIRLAGADKALETTYYADLATLGAATVQHNSAIIDTFVGLQRPGLTVIVDNAQADPTLAQEIVTQWHRLRQHARLIVVSTRAHAHAPRRTSDGQPRHDLTVVQVAATASVLQRTFHTIRNQRPGLKALPDPEQDVLTQWAASFDDACVFAHAVAGSIDRFRFGDWTLDRSAAIRYVAQRYETDQASRRDDLTILAILGAHGVYVRPHLLKAKDELVRAGLIIEHDYGKRLPLPLCRLENPATSRLLLGALGLTPKDQRAVIAAIAVSSPATVGLFACRLLRTGRADGGEILADLRLDLPDTWERILRECGLVTTLTIARRALAVQATTSREIDAALAQLPDEIFDERLRQASLCEIDEAVALTSRYRLNVTDATLRRLVRGLRAHLVASVAEQPTPALLWEALDVTRRLSPYVFAAAKQPAFEAAADMLSRLGEATLGGGVTEFGGSDVRAIVKLLELLDREARSESPLILAPLHGLKLGELAAQVSRARPDAVPGLLGVIARLDHVLAKALAQELARSTNVSAIADSLVNDSSVAAIPKFVARLRELRSPIPGVAGLTGGLEKRLLKPTRSAVIARRLEDAPMRDVVRVIRHDAKWVTEAVSQVNRANWDADSARFLVDAKYLRSLELGLTRVRRMDLMIGPAYTLLRSADPVLFRNNKVFLVVVSTTLRHAKDCATWFQVKHFMDHVAPKAQLSKAFDEAESRIIAASLHGIWAAWGPRLVMRFRNDRMRSRAVEELSRPWAHGERFWARLEFLGVLDLVGALPRGFLPAADGFEDAFAAASLYEAAERDKALFQRIRAWRGLHVIREAHPHLKQTITQYAEKHQGFDHFAVGEPGTVRDRHRSLSYDSTSAFG